MLLLAFGGRAFAAASAPFTTKRDTVTLVSEADTYKPGTPLRLALHFAMAPGWHTYWSNPGDAGAPPTIELAGAAAGPFAYPTPTRLIDGPIASYAYTGDLLLPFVATPPAGATTLSLDAHATWLICAATCVPGEAKFHLELPAGTGAPGPEAPLFAAADAASPRASPFPAHVTSDGTLWLDAPGIAARDAYFFPDTPGVLDQLAPQTLTLDRSGLRLALKPLKPLDPHGTLGGVLALTDAQGGHSALTLSAPVAPLPAGMAAMPLLRALLLAFAGGLILNLMPCVLPVLAIKALAISRLGGSARGAVRREAALYTLGVLAAFLAIGGVTLAARAAGMQAGWGVQFQSPVFGAAMAWVLFAVGLSMSGVFAIGSSMAGMGQGLASRSAFFTGLLAVVVATPCTAPFMASALAAALALPPLAGMAIFAALGLGLAAPYGVLAVSPSLARFLPRPGAWMEVFKQILAFPMYAAAIWLAWVVAQQAGATGVLIVLVGAWLIGICGWAWGIASLRERGFAWRGLALASALGVAALLAELAWHPPAQAEAAPTDGHVSFSEKRLSELVAAHRPVLVDMTAAWCVTCLVNERVALSPAAVRAAFAQHHVTYMVGDWTRQDPAITAYLTRFGRSGVPLYVFYPPAGPPEVLPQILTPGDILMRFAALP